MIAKAVIASPAATPDQAPHPAALASGQLQESPGLARIGDRAAADGLGDLGERRREIGARLIKRQRQPAQLRRQALRRRAVPACGAKSRSARAPSPSPRDASRRTSATGLTRADRRLAGDQSQARAAGADPPRTRAICRRRRRAARSLRPGRGGPRPGRRAERERPVRPVAGGPAARSRPARD